VQCSTWLSVNWRQQRLRRGERLYWAALLVIGAALIHLASASEEVSRSGLLAALFLGCAVVQLVTGITIVAIPAVRISPTAALIEAAAVLLWILAHTTGLPIVFARWRPEPPNLPGLFLPAMELSSAILLLHLILRGARVSAPRV
jgi:hypothetical protein